MKQMTAFCLTLMMVITMALSPALEAAAAVSAPLLAYSFEAQEDLDAFTTKGITQVNSGNNGSGALKWTSGGRKSRILAGQEQVTIQTGKYYYASVYVKHGAATALNFTLQTNFVDFAKGDFSYESTTNTGKFVYGSTVSDWNDCEQLLKVYSIPSSNEFTRIWLLFKVNALYDSDGNSVEQGQISFDLVTPSSGSYDVIIDDFYLAEETGDQTTDSVYPVVTSTVEKTQVQTEENLTVGDQLTVTAYINSTLGLNNATFGKPKFETIKWQRSSDGTTWTDIEGASVTPSTHWGATSAYTLQSADVDCYVRPYFMMEMTTGSGSTVKAEVPNSTDFGKVQVNTVASAPVAREVSISGNPVQGEELTASYQYSDENNDPEDTEQTSIVWQISADGETDWTEAGTGAAYTVAEGDIGSYLRIAVTPYSTVEPYQGETVYSDVIGPCESKTSFDHKPLFAYDFEAESHLTPFSYTGSPYELASGIGNNASQALTWKIAGQYPQRQINTQAGYLPTIKAGKYYYASVFVSHDSDTAKTFELGLLPISGFGTGEFTYDTKNVGKLIADAETTTATTWTIGQRVTVEPGTVQRIWLTFKVNALFDGDGNNVSEGQVRVYLKETGSDTGFSVTIDDFYMIEEAGEDATNSVYPVITSNVERTSQSEERLTEGDQLTVTVYGNSTMGLNNSVYGKPNLETIKWQRSSDGTNWTDIEGASVTPSTHWGATSTYTLQSADIDCYVRPYMIMSLTAGDGAVIRAETPNYTNYGKVYGKTVVYPPEASELSISGKVLVGRELTASYQYSDGNGDPEDTSKTAIVWQTSADGETDWTEVGSGKTYTPGEEDVGRYLRIAVTPYSTVMPFQGETVYSQAYGPCGGVSEILTEPLYAFDFEDDSQLDCFAYQQSPYQLIDGKGNNGSTALTWLVESQRQVNPQANDLAKLKADKCYYASIYVSHDSETDKTFEIGMLPISGFSTGDFVYDTANVGKLAYNDKIASSSKDWHVIQRVTVAPGETKRIWLTFQVNAMYDSAGNPVDSGLARIYLKEIGSEQDFNIYLDDFYLVEEDGDQTTACAYPIITSQVERNSQGETLNEGDVLTATVYGNSTLGLNNASFGKPKFESVKWQRSADGESWTDIAGTDTQPEGTWAVTSDYTTTSEDVGCFVRPYFVMTTTTGDGTVHKAETANYTNFGRVFGTSGALAPRAESLKIKGNITQDNPLTAEYDYFDGNGDPEDTLKTEIKWQTSEDGETGWTDVGTGSSYIPEKKDIGKYLRICVIPYATVEPFAGNPAYSQAFGPCGERVTQLNYYVATDGDDSADGSFEHPFATVEKARDTLRTQEIPSGGATVYIRGGDYQFTKTFSLNERDSGTEGAPIVYRPYGDEKVVFSAGYQLKGSDFTQVSGEMKDILIDSEAKSKVVVADLAALGVSKIGEYAIQDNDQTVRTPVITVDGQSTKLSCWPNSFSSEEWAKIYCAPNDPDYAGTNLGNGQTDADTRAFTVQYDDETAERAEHWNHNTDGIIMTGNLIYEWYQTSRYVTLNKEKKQATARENRDTTYGVAEGKEQPVKYMNVYEELDSPGEWYIDWNTQKLYLYPYDTLNDDSSIKISGGNFMIIYAENASHITFSGIEMWGSKRTAAGAINGDSVVFDGCDVNTCEESAFGITGKNSGVKNSRMYNLGKDAVSMSGGSRETLERSNNFVTNCQIHDFARLKESYSAGVSIWESVGAVVSHNEIYNAPHYAIYYTGTDNVIEYNVIHDVCVNAADMGSVYTGRHFNDFNTVVRYNHFYNIGNGLSGRRYYPGAFFADDGSGNIEIYGNIFGGKGMNGVETIKVHGGFNVKIEHNLFIDTAQCVYVQQWPTKYLKIYLTTGGDKPKAEYLDRWKSISSNPLYWERWPFVKDFEESKDNIYAIPDTFKSNLIIYVNEEPKPLEMDPNDSYHAINGWWRNISTLPHEGVRTPFEGINGVDGQTNILLTNENGTNKNYFTDFEGGNYSFRDDSLYKLFEGTDPLGGFPEIPFEEIGMYAVKSSIPAASGVDVLQTSGGLRGLYDYSDASRNAEGESSYRWLVSDTIDGSYTPISGQTGRLLENYEEYSGKFIKFEVTPVSVTGEKGAPVLSPAFAAAADKSALSQIIAAIDQAASEAAIGTALGDFTEENVKLLKDTVAAAKAVEDKDDATQSEISQAAAALSEAYAAFLKTANNKEVTGNDQTTVTAGLEDVTIDFTGGQKELTVSFEEELSPAAVITAGEVQITLAKGTKIPNKTLKITLPEEPSVHLFGEIGQIVSVGEPEDQFNLPIRIELAGSVTQDVVRVGTESYEKVTKVMQEDQASALGASEHYGKIGISADRIAVWTRLGGEYAIANLKTPSSGAQLKSMQINGKDYVKFNPETTSYRYALPAGTTQLPVITAEAAEAGATVTIENVTQLPGTATVTVTAEDLKTVTTYSVAFFVTPDNSPTPAPTVQPTAAPSGSGGGSVVIPGGSKNQNTTTEESNPFTDITNHWAKDDILTMYQKGVVVGVTPTAFEPDRAVTRAEFAALIVRALHLNTTTENSFSDVSDEAWYAESIKAAASAGLMQGYQGLFRPEDTITREEMAVVIVKSAAFLGRSEADQKEFSFADQDQISSWAKDSVAQAYAAGLLSGMSDGRFAPQENATRAQTVSVLNRLFQ